MTVGNLSPEDLARLPASMRDAWNAAGEEKRARMLPHVLAWLAADAELVAIRDSLKEAALREAEEELRRGASRH